jgi:ankyrin repeat protein
LGGNSSTIKDEIAEANRELHKAAASGGSVKYWVRNEKADVNGRNAEGLTPLMVAAQRGHASVVADLLEVEADAGLTNPAGATARMLAVEHNNANCVMMIDEMLLRRAQNLLLGAIREKDTALLRRLLEEKIVPDLDRPASTTLGAGYTPLGLALSEGSLDCITLLLEAGANPEHQPRSQDKTYLCSAIAHYRPDPRIVAKLLDYGAKPDTPSDETWPLGLAAAEGHETIVTLLLARGADAGHQNRAGGAAHLAALHGHTAVLRLLARHGAPLNDENPSGHTPLELAVLHKHRSAFDALLEAGVDPRHVDKNGITPVMQAAWSGEAGVIPELLRRGLDIDAQSNDGHTALMYAAIVGKGESVRVLLENGADAARKNEKNETAFDIARDNGHTPLAEIFGAHAAKSVTQGLATASAVRAPFKLVPRKPK